MRENNMAEVDDFLAHYGVTGMKWGVRKGGLKDRVKGAVTDSVERRLVTNRAIAKGQGQTRDYRRVALKRYGGFGTGAALSTGSRKAAEKRANELEGMLERVKSGKMKLGDKLDAAFTTPVSDLVVSRRDKRALPGSPEAKVQNGAKRAAKIVGGVAGAYAIATLSTPQGKQAMKELANQLVGAAVNAKKASNARAASATRRSDTHGLATGPTIRLQQNPTTGNWV